MKKVKSNILIVDGYNVINAWEELSKIADKNLEEARSRLNDIITEFAEYNQVEAYVVYDAYNVKISKDRITKIKRTTIVFTKEDQTADAYIEKFLHDYKYKRNTTIRIATNDLTEQNMVLGKGAVRLTARELWLEVQESKKDIKRVLKKTENEGYTVEQRLDPKTYEILEKIRRS